MGLAAEGHPTVSAAICTRDRPALLARALRSLANQTSPADEVLVVDNDPPDEGTYRAVTSAGVGARYVTEGRPGLDFARNRALLESRGDIVAFLDDDAVAGNEWVAAIRGRFRSHRRAAAVMGRVEALSLDTEGQRLFEANGGFSRGEERVVLPRDARRRLHGLPAPLAAWAISVGSGCSMALRRASARAIGGFDEALDMGDFLPGGGDLDMVWRLLDAGAEVIYEPEAVAFHEHRHDRIAALSQVVEHNRSLIAVLAKGLRRTRGRRRWGVAAFLAWRLMKPGTRLARSAVGRDPLPAGALLRLWGACWRGLATYPAAQRRARTLAAGEGS